MGVYFAVILVVSVDLPWVLLLGVGIMVGKFCGCLRGV